MATNKKSAEGLDFTLRGERPQAVPVTIDGRAYGVSTNALAVSRAIRGVLVQTQAVQAAMGDPSADLDAAAESLGGASRLMAREVFGDDSMLGEGTVDVVEVTRLVGIAREAMASPAYRAAQSLAE